MLKRKYFINDMVVVARDKKQALKIYLTMMFSKEESRKLYRENARTDKRLTEDDFEYSTDYEDDYLEKYPAIQKGEKASGRSRLLGWTDY